MWSPVALDMRDVDSIHPQNPCPSCPYDMSLPVFMLIKFTLPLLLKIEYLIHVYTSIFIGTGWPCHP